MTQTDRVDGPRPPAPAPGARQFLYAEEIAAMTGTCLETVYRWLRAGKFPGSRKLGRRFLVPREVAAKVLGLNFGISAAG